MSKNITKISENNKTIIESTKLERVTNISSYTPSSDGGGETAASIKTKYESNANTNAFTDSYLTQLANTAPQATTYTKTEIDALNSAIVSGVSFKAAVATFADLATTYPTPSEGWAAGVNDEDKIYIYTDSGWIVSGGDSVPLATALLDGKLSAADFIKLASLTIDGSGNITTPILQANGTGVVQINANNLKFATFAGTLLVTYNLSGFKLLRTAAISGTSFQYDSAVTDASAETAGFYINNKNVTTKKIISFESNNVEKAYIDKDGGFVGNFPSYDDDSAAGTGGLTTGQQYQTTGSGASPLNVAGIVMVKQ